MNIKEYLKENGITQKWVAQKIGCDRNLFNQFLLGKRLLPKKYWKNLIALCGGKIQVEDIINLEELKKKYETDYKSASDETATPIPD